MLKDFSSLQKHNFKYGLIVFVSLFSFTLFSAPLPSGAMELYLSFDEVVQKADLIFLGKVVDQQCRYGPNQKMIFTDVYFEVTRLIHQNATTKTITGNNLMLTFAGGELGGENIRVSDVPSFELGERYLIFTQMDGRTYASPIIGAFQGLFRIISDETSGVSYPLTYGKNPIVKIRDGKLVTGPPVAQIRNGVITAKNTSGKSAPNVSPGAPQPAPGMPPEAKAKVSAERRAIPEKILSLDELVSEIHKRITEKQEER